MIGQRRRWEVREQTPALALKIGQGRICSALDELSLLRLDLAINAHIQHGTLRAIFADQHRRGASA